MSLASIFCIGMAANNCILRRLDLCITTRMPIGIYQILVGTGLLRLS